jgi:type IV pilus assembly protein PilA
MKSIQKGFTLIELMIVVAIIGILAAIAIPAYQDYTVRSQITEGMNLASDLKAGVAEYYAQVGTWPDLVNLGISAATNKAGKYVTQINVTGGQIDISYGNQANSTALAAGQNVLSLRPAPNVNGDVTWVCGRGADPTSGSVVGTDATDVLDKYLPQNCRTP